MDSNRNRVKVVLAQPPLRNVLSAATPDYVDDNRGFTPPMGLLYIQAAVERSPHESVFIDANLHGWSHEEAARQILAQQPDLIGFQAMTFTLLDVCLTAKEIKKIDPRVKIVVGGPHPTIFPRETANLEYIDFAFAGEGEVGFPVFLNVLHDPAAWASVSGLAYKNGDQTIYVPSKGLLSNLDSIAYPARKSSCYREYSSVLARKNPITVMISSRGCPFNCVFCNRMGRKYRCHSAEFVLGEIETILELGIEEIFIHDDTFTIKRDRVEKICNGIIERGYDITWEARTRVDCVDEELLALMRKAGCYRLSFGVESGSEKVLKSIRKGIDLAQVEKIFASCKREGIVSLADFMFGNLDEEREDIEKSIQLVGKINPDYVQYSICSPYPGTPLYQIGLEMGLIREDIWQKFAENPLQDFHSPIWTQNFSEEELRIITKEAYRKFYMRPTVILREIMRINSLSKFNTMARGALGMLMK